VNTFIDKYSGQISASVETVLIGRTLEVRQKTHREIKPTDHNDVNTLAEFLSASINWEDYSTD
jgi:hypothetical protein